MARREPRILEKKRKEIYEHFKPKEMQVFAAYMKAFDGIWPYRKQIVNKETDEVSYKEMPLPTYFRTSQQAPRPWTCYERFMRAVAAFTRKMEDNPGQGLQFAIAYLEADGTIDSGDIQLDPKEIAESKKIYQEMGIIGGDGLHWGDSEKLDEYVNGYGGKKCLDFGFKKCEPPPFQGEIQELTGASDLDSATVPESKMEFEGKLTDEGKDAPMAPRRGRPKKVAAV